MKTIVCYGDSNTHGFDPRCLGRYDYAERWPGALQNLLDREHYYIIEEGLNSRTTCHPDFCYDDNKSGVDTLPTVIKSHMPIDLLIIMLGSNDLKLRFHMQPGDVARGIGRLIDTAKHVSASKSKTGQPCDILIISPPHITEHLRVGGCYAEFGDRAIALSEQLADAIRPIAETYGVGFLDASQIVTPSELDGLHLMPEMHQKLAWAIANEINSTLGKSF